MAEDEIRARQIILEDENGDPRVMLSSSGGGIALIMLEAGEREHRVSIGVLEGGRPFLNLQHGEGGIITLGFDGGKAVIDVQDEDGTRRSFGT